MKDSSGFHRTSGDFSAISNVIWNEATFPADAGIFQSVVGAFLQRVCLPRACGDLSVERGAYLQRFMVFPAHAGIFPSSYLLTAFGISLPRACRDRSELQSLLGSQLGSSPRARGSFCVYRDQPTRKEVFPARAGIFPYKFTA